MAVTTTTTNDMEDVLPVDPDNDGPPHPHDDLLASVGLEEDDEEEQAQGEGVAVGVQQQQQHHPQESQMTADHHGVHDPSSSLVPTDGSSTEPPKMAPSPIHGQPVPPSQDSLPRANEQQQQQQPDDEDLAIRTDPNVTIEPIWDPHELDVLTGRGAMVNANLGNKKFRSLCFARKMEFENGNHATKRRVATEIVQLTQQSWGSRFLTRNIQKSKYQTTHKAKTSKQRDTEANSNNTDNAKDETDQQQKNDPTPTSPQLSPPPSHLVAHSSGGKGPWYEMSMEQAIQKACQVIRDHQRPDRLSRGGTSATSSMMLNSVSNDPLHHRPITTSLTPKKKNRATATPALEEGVAATLHSVINNQSSPVSNTAGGGRDTPYGVHDHDVLCGRGAYVNGHTGNHRLRQMATARKTQFDNGNYTEKRALATEIVMQIRNLNPPGRFLRKLPSGSAASSSSNGVIVQGGPEFEGIASTNNGDTTLWEELSDERAIHKACQVMRDMDRADRKDREERRKLRLLKKQGKLPATATTTTAPSTTTDSTSPTGPQDPSTAVAAAAAAAAAASATSVDEAVAEAMDKALEAANQQHRVVHVATLEQDQHQPDEQAVEL